MNRDAQGFGVVRVRILFAWIGVFLLVLTAIALWQRTFIFEQTKAQMLGNMELPAFIYGRELSERSDAVEIFEIEPAPKATNRVAIHLGSQIKEYEYIAKRELKGADAKDFLERWGNMYFDWRIAGLCHDPGFVILSNGRRRVVHLDSIREILD